MPDIIQLLPDSVANQIAAGEVIQRPASVVKELVENAIESMQSSHSVDRVLEIVTRDENGFVIVDVIDTGNGISEDMAVKVFEPFYSSKTTSNECRGLGLTMVHEIINEHSGMITMDNNTPRRFIMSVHLPAGSSN